MTDYLNQPSVPDAFGYDMVDMLMTEAWLHCQPSSAADQLGWDTLQKLRVVPYGLYLNFEQGRNIPPMVLAWREQPDLDLANYDDVGYELHAVAYPGHREEPAPEPVARFHEPVDAFIVELAERIDQAVEETPQRQGTLLVQHGKITTARQILTNAAVLEVAGFILARIAEHMVLRPAVYDEDNGELLGLGDDIAPGLASSWRNFRR